MIEGFVSIGDVRLEVLRWPGQGVPILLLHEGLGSATIWRDFPAKLVEATGRPVVAWSRRGYGRSDPLPGLRDRAYLHDEARAVPALLDALDIEQAHFFGHSDGASIALLVAAWFPHRVATMVIEAPHVFVEPITLAGTLTARDAYAPTGMARRLARYHDDPDRVFRQWNDIWIDPAFQSWRIDDELGTIETPTLLIQGLDDEYGTMAQIERTAARLRDARQLQLDRCGHSPHRDRTDMVLDATAAFLRGRA